MLGLKAEAPTKDYSLLYFEPNARFIWFGNGEIWGQVTDHKPRYLRIMILRKNESCKVYFSVASFPGVAIVKFNLIFN